MRKKLIAAIIVALILIAAAVGVIVYMETRPGAATNPGNDATGTKADGTAEATEETVGLSLPTENADEVTPEVTFGEEDIVPPVTGDTGSGETEDPDSNETPEDIF